MRCVVLSGATVPFVELIEAINQQLVNKLELLGFTELFVQYGHAKSAFSCPSSSKLTVTGFDFRTDIKQLISTAQLVVSHAGSGSVLDSLDRGHASHGARKVIVVVNTKLMDNHQLELAEKLEQLGCILMARGPDRLEEAVDTSMRREFAQLPECNSIQHIVDEERNR